MGTFSSLYLRNPFLLKVIKKSSKLLSRNGKRTFTSTNHDFPAISVSDIRRNLRLEGYIVNDGFTCLISKCPVCKSLSNNNSGELYINKVTGFSLCATCNYTGQWSDLEKIIKNPKDWLKSNDNNNIYKISESFSQILNSLSKETIPFSNIDSEKLKAIFNVFDLPISPEVHKILPNARISKDNKILYFPLENSSARIVGYIKITNDTLTETTIPENDCSGLFYLKGTRNYSKEHPVVIVPTIGDALAVAVNKISGGVICLPYGLSQIPQQLLPALEKWPKLTLWLGADGTKHIRNLTRKLGETRCLVVRTTDSQPPPKKAMQQQLDLKTIYSSAHPLWHKSIITFEHLREDLLSDLQNVEKVEGIKWKRFPTLNKLLRGHRRGELTILTGPTGCGKTTFCSEYSLDLAQRGVNTLWGSFEIKNTRLVKTMLQQLAGLPLEGNMGQFDKFADQFQNLPLYFLVFHGQQSIKDVMEAVYHATYVHDIAHVIIDNVQFMLGIGDEPSRHLDRFWKQDAIIAAFRTFATKTNCHVTLVMHPRKEKDVDELSSNSIFGSAKASQEADNVLIIQDKRLTAINGKKYLQVVKNRYAGDLGLLTLEFDKRALSYAQKVKSQNKEQKT